MPKPRKVSAKPKSKERNMAGPRPKAKRRNLVEAFDILASMPQEAFDAVAEMKRADRLGAHYVARNPAEAKIEIGYRRPVD